MEKEKMLEVLRDSFKDFVFFEDEHYYECKGNRVGVSVTSFISQFENEFKKEEIAKKCSIKENRPVEEILKEWKYKADFACEKGTTCHEYAQSLWNSLYSYDNYNMRLFDKSDKYLESVYKIQEQAKNFRSDYNYCLEHLVDELPIGSEEYDIASCVDHLFYNKLTGGLVLVDYKTNSFMKGYNKEPYKKPMKVPLSHLNDDDLHHYHIQLSIYKYLIEKYTKLKVEEMFIVYMSENIKNYEIIKIPYLEEEVEIILELRKVKKMSKIILVMGEPATGKTVSLRNIPKNELYYIDCDKKGLNYKGWKNDFNEENKNYCRTTDSDMIAKILKGISNTREDIKYVAIDTINSVMLADEMRRSKDKNFDKWVDLASSVYNIIVDTAPDLRDDMTVIFIGHTQTDDEGFTRLLTNGKKLNKIGLEKYFDTVLISKNMDGRYVFETTSPNSTARVPMGFDCEQYIENDLYEIIKELKEF